MRMSIRVKLIAAILGPLLIVYLGVLALTYHGGKKQALDMARGRYVQLASSHAARLNTWFSTTKEATTAAADLAGEQRPELLPRRVDGMLGRAVMTRPMIQGACIVLEPDVIEGHKDFGRFVSRPDPDRQPRSKPVRGPGPADRDDRRAGARGPLPPRRGGQGGVGGNLFKRRPDVRSEPWYVRAGEAGEAVWLDPGDVEAPNGEPVVRCAAPIIREEKFIGVVAMDVSVSLLQRYVGGAEAKGGYGLLVARDGAIIAHPDEALPLTVSLSSLAEREAVPELAGLAEKMAEGSDGVVRLTDFHTSVDSWVAHASVSSVGWSFAAVIPEDHILQPVREFFERSVAIMLGGLGLIIAVVLLVSIRITRPIAHLATAVQRLASGDLTATVEDVCCSDEIGRFVSTYNHMVIDLRQHVEALTRETAARKAVESELAVAREIQTSLLPHAFPPFPDRREFDLYGMNVPAKAVAGDFFDFFMLDDDRLAFLIADVSGKGVPAALYMAMTRTMIREHAAAGAAPADVLTRTNHLLAADNDRCMFVTLFFGHYHTRTGQMIFTNAGHNPPCVSAAGGAVRLLDNETDPILGIFPDQQYRQHETQLDVADQLVLYTDGVTEARDQADQQFQLDQLTRLIGANSAADPEQMCRLVVDTIEDYRAHPQQDDVTMLVLRRND